MAGTALEPVAGPGGARLLRLHGPDGARVDISETGAQACSWVDVRGRERLFLSPNARFGGGSAIRGGVPVVFPQFSDRGALAKHGFARTQPWRAAADETFADGRTGLRLTLDASAATRTLWPFEFEATLELRLGIDSLELRLGVHNRGAAPFAFTAALHSYLAVADAGLAEVRGLEGRPYEDSAAGGARRVQPEPALRFAGEVDRIYPGAAGPLVLACGPDRLRVESEGFRDVVVWNPGPALAAGLADLGPGQHRHFVCIEAAVVLEPVVLAPGEAWSGCQRLLA